jgi:hypothetical protein
MTNSFIGLHIATDIIASRTSIRRKPLPPNSPYSPPNSPRINMIISPMSPPTPHPVDPSPPIQETSFIQNESIKTVSLGALEAAEQEPLTLASHDAEPKSPPADHFSACRENEYGRRMSETSFPMRPKSFDRRVVTRNRRRWIIVIVVALIIVTMASVLVGIGMGKFMNGKERSEME